MVPEDDGSMTWLETVPGMVAEPNVAADVAKIFTNKVNLPTYSCPFMSLTVH